MPDTLTEEQAVLLAAVDECERAHSLAAQAEKAATETLLLRDGWSDAKRAAWFDELRARVTAGETTVEDGETLSIAERVAHDLGEYRIVAGACAWLVDALREQTGGPGLPVPAELEAAASRLEAQDG